jgi:glycosyltransferase involved in cell wall biosynthesis
MKISVIIATLNAARFLDEALDSITKQSRPAEEIVIVDGGSTDDTVAIAKRHPNVLLVTQSGRGLPDAWNFGLSQTSGDTIAFLDSDDRWTPSKLQLQSAILTKDSTVQGVVGHVRFFLETGAQCPNSFKPELLEGTYPAPMPGALLIRRKALDQVGLFDTRFPVACDIDWFARLRDLRMKVVTLPDLLIHKRVHQGNLSLAAVSQPSYSTELVRLLFEKRRRLFANET